MIILDGIERLNSSGVWEKSDCMIIHDGIERSFETRKYPLFFPYSVIIHDGIERLTRK